MIIALHNKSIFNHLIKMFYIKWNEVSQHEVAQQETVEIEVVWNSYILVLMIPQIYESLMLDLCENIIYYSSILTYLNICVFFIDLSWIL